MKKLILAVFAVTCAASVFAQGSITFNNRIGGQYISHVYAPLANYPWFVQIGQGTADYLNSAYGTTSWAGWTLIGTALGGQYGGSSTMAELLIANGSTTEASLLPTTPIATFRTGAGAGWIQGAITVTANNVHDPGLATLEMVAWDDSSGLYSTWALAQAAWYAGWIAAGKSQLWNDTLGGFGTPVPGFPPNLQAESFNLYFLAIPEPSSFALAGLGLATLLVSRRRK